MKPIENFTAHPSLKYDPVKYIFAIRRPHNESELYLFTEKSVRKIIPIKAGFTNIGEPYHKLARFYFNYTCVLPEYREEESIDIGLDDLPDLIIMLMDIGIDLPLDKELQKYIDND